MKSWKFRSLVSAVLVCLAAATNVQAQARGHGGGGAVARPGGATAVGRPGGGAAVGTAVARPYGVPYYRPYGYYGHYGYPFGVGFGLGFYAGFGYPYGWYGYPYYWGYPYGYPGYGYEYGYPAPYYGAAYGGVRIEDAPKNAQVFADGYYAGIVDDFDGTFQHLDLPGGVHKIEVHPTAQAPVAFDVNVQPGQTITIHAGPTHK
jgi:hypothetical protein